MTGIFRAYEAQNPNVKIELISLPFPALRQRLVVSARAGDPPDVAYMDGRWVPEMAAPGLLLDITEQVAKLDRSDWYDEPWRGAELRGRIFAVPDRIDPWLVYYNTDHFQKAGITPFPADHGRARRDREEAHRRRRLRLGPDRGRRIRA